MSIKQENPARSIGRPIQRMAGFTLVELLIVIAIIALIVGITLPAITMVRTKSQAAATSSLIMALDQACQSYSQDNNGRFPGQDRQLQQRMIGASADSRVTGSQVLAAAMGGYKIGPAGKFQRDTTLAVYFQFDAEQLDYPTGDEGVDDTLSPANDATQTLTGARYTILDAFGDQMPLLYYASRPGRAGSGLDGVFNFEDNKADGLNLYPADTMEDEFYDLVRRGKGPLDTVDFDDTMYNADSFIIISAGADREFFTAEDDLVNFSR